MLAAQLSAQLFLMICVGIFAQKKGIVSREFDAQLTNFVMKIALPCLIVSSMLVDFSVEELKNCLKLLGLSVAVQAVELILGQLGFLALGKGYSGRIFRFGAVFTNYSFMGIPVVQALFGTQGLFYYVVFLLPVRLFYYLSAEALLSPPELARKKKTVLGTLRAWASPPTVAALLGAALYITQLPLPSVVTGVLSGIGSICSPMGMILCGLSLGKYEFKSLFRARYLILPLARNFLIPVLTWLLLRPLGLDPMLVSVVVVYTALPVSSLTAAFTIQYDPEPEARFESAGTILISTLLAAVTIPLWVTVLGL